MNSATIVSMYFHTYLQAVKNKKNKYKNDYMVTQKYMYNSKLT